MYAVIFSAKIKLFDEEYSQTAEKLRQLAFSEYFCRDFISYAEGEDEVAISWWDSLEDIQAWKNNPAHKEAQLKGREQWYASINVQVLEVLKEYS